MLNINWRDVLEKKIIGESCYRDIETIMVVEMKTVLNIGNEY